MTNFQKNKDLIALIFSISGFLITVITTAGPDKFLIGALVSIALLTIAKILFEFSLSRYIIYSIAVTILCFSLFLLVKGKNEPVVATIQVEPLSTHRHDSVAKDPIDSGTIGAILEMKDSAKEIQTTLIVSMIEGHKLHPSAEGTTGHYDSNELEDSNHDLREKALLEYELSVNEKDGVLPVKGNVKTFYRRANASNKEVKLRVGLSNPSSKTRYLRLAKIKVLNYRRGGLEDTLLILYDQIAVTFDEIPSPAFLERINERYDLEVVNRFEELFTFQALNQFDGVMLSQLVKEENIVKVRRISRGTGHSSILFTTYEVDQIINSLSEEVKIEINEELPHNGTAGLAFLLNFGELGQYDLYLEIVHGNEVLVSDAFSVILD